MSLIRQVKIQDSSGNIIDTSQDANGDYHLGTSIIQSIISSTNNYTDANLASGATFTGTADETFGINGIQVFHTADQDCTVYIDQSIDNTFADSTKTFTSSTVCFANKPCARIIASIAPYYRLRVTNTDLSGSTTTKLETATGMTPIMSTLPADLSPQGNLQVVASLRGDENYERHAWVSPTDTLGINKTIRLTGTNFDGSTKDTTFWTETVANGGTVTQDGKIQLDTNTTANGSASYTSVRKGRFVIGSANKFQGLYKFVTAGTANNLRRCGAYLATDGFFFQLDGTTFSVGYRKNSTDTLVNNGSFNGNIGPNFIPLTTTYYKFEIEYTPKGIFWYVDGKLLHKLGSGHLSNLLTLPIAFENVNSGGITTDIAFDCLGVVIMRLGELHTTTISKYAGTGGLANGTHILKVGAGDLHRITVTDNTGTLLVYDGLSAAGVLMANLDASKTVGTMEIGSPFSDGLTVVVAGTPKMTIIFE